MRPDVRSTLPVVMLAALWSALPIALLVAASRDEAPRQLARSRPGVPQDRVDIRDVPKVRPARFGAPAPRHPNRTVSHPSDGPERMALRAPPNADGAAELDVVAPRSGRLELPIPRPRPFVEKNDTARRAQAARGEFDFDVDEPDDEDYRLLIQAARTAVRLRNLALADSRFRELLESFPEAALARGEYAGLLLSDNRIQEAADQYRILLKAWPKNAKLHGVYGGALFRLGQNTAALTELRRAIELDPRDEDSAVELTKMLGQMKMYPQAYDVYLRYLAGLDQNEERVQRLLAPLLLSIDRPLESRNLYAPLAAANPDDAAILVAYISASAILGDHVETMSLVRRLEEIGTVDSRVLTDLGTLLYDVQDDLASLAVFQQALGVDADNSAARIGIVRIHLRNLELSEAWVGLQSFGPNCHDRDYLLARASFHYIAGEYSESISLCEEMLARNACDADARLVLADALAASGQDAIAAAQYRAAVAEATSSTRRRALTKLAQHLAARRLFKDAVAQLTALVAEDPSDAFTVAALVRVLIDAGNPEEGVHVAAGAMNPPGSYPRREVVLRSAMGRAFLKQGAFQQALQQYREASALPTAQRADVIHGLYRANEALQFGAEARDGVMLALSTAAFPFGRRLLLADDASECCEYDFAGLMLNQVARGARNNPAAIIRLGEIQLKTHSGDCGVGHFEQAIQTSPANIRARIGLARALALNRCPAESIAVYQELLRFQPTSIQINREMARVINQWKGIGAAAPVYEHAEALGEQVMADAHLANPVSEPGVFVLGFEQVDGEVAAVSNEKQAKSIDGWQPLAAIPFYRGEQELEPANIDAHFSLGQVYGGLNWTHASMHEYGEILNIDPCHRDSQIALERARLELGPQSLSNMYFFTQNGRAGLSTVTQLRLTEMGRICLGDEDEYIEAGYGYILYDSPLIPTVHGNMARMRVQKKLAPRVVAFTEIRVEEFQFGFTTRPLFDAGLQARILPNLDFRPTIFMENVVQSGGSIVQNIYRIGMNLETQYRPTPWWAIDSLYRLSDYSDNNVANEFGIHNAFRVKLPPHQVRILADYDFINFQNSRITVPPGASILDISHPYFAPAGFSYATLGTEWKHWLWPDMFKGANQLWYQLYAGGRVDSTSQPYFVFRGSMQYDIRPWMTVSAGTSLIRSSVYNNVDVSAQLVVRF